MTKREHKALQEHFNRMGEFRDKADKAFKKLQDLNGTEGTGTRWCSAEHNYKDLLSVGKDYTYIYNEYVKATANDFLLMELGSTLAELNFWKH